MDNNKEFKSGFVSIIGRPNVGKSTLLNTIISKKISIVTNKAQTTRNQIQGIYNDSNLQIVLIDTPGIHTHKNKFGKYMNNAAFKSLEGIDFILFIAPSNEIIGKNDLLILEKLKDYTKKTFLLVSKIDLVSEKELKNKINDWKEKTDFIDIIPISAKNNINIKKIISILKNKLPNGPKYFPDNQYTDQPEKFLIKEIIRENILEITKQEVPHSTVIMVNNIIDDKNILKIYASIIVERKSQKPIIIGKNGNLIKQIGIMSRKELEKIFNTKIFLDLFVKIEDNWRKEESKIKKLGYSNSERY